MLAWSSSEMKCIKMKLLYCLQVVVSDTVGFIQKLPPQLVAAFRSTLEHIESSSIILHVVDVSHPLAAAQSEAVCQVRHCPPAGVTAHLS